MHFNQNHMERSIMQTRKWALAVLSLPLVWTPAHTDESSRGGHFSPRVNYDDWTPLGRGDPLKNDPTYDYVPPFVDDVRYWMHPLSKNPAMSKFPSSNFGSPEIKRHDTNHNDPGPDSRKDIFDAFMKFIDGPKFGNSNRQTIRQSPVRNQYYSQQYKPYRPPHSKPFDYRTSVSPPEEQVIKHLSSSVQQIRPPHTVLMPPPMSTSDMFTSVPAPSLLTHNFTNYIPESNVYIIQDADQLQNLTNSRPENKAHIAQNITNYNDVYVAQNTEQSFFIRQTSPYPEGTEMKTQPATTAQPSNKIRITARPVVTAPQIKTTPTTDNRGQTIRFSLLQTLLQDERITTTTVTPSTTRTLTTDPLFSHYKQPAEPLKGPMYLIIQGHSKVQTYGANKSSSYHGIPIQENEI